MTNQPEDHSPDDQPGHDHDHGADDHGGHGGHDHDHGGHDHGAHGHAKDRGPKAMLRYLRLAPTMWRSEINRAVLDMVGPAPDEQVIDIGSGMGATTILAAKAGASVTAVDPTPFLRRVLTVRRLFQSARGRIRVVDGAAEVLPVADRSTDALWSVNTMHHWVDPERASAEIARVLRDGGRIVLVDEDFDDPSHPEYERFKSRRGDNEDDGGHRHGFAMVDAEQMGGLLRGAGLTEVEAEKRLLAGRPVIAVTGRR